jgi:kojibiose phosphorylase
MLEIAPPPEAAALDAALDRPFRVIAFDWDGTAVPDRLSDASAVGRAMDSLLRAGVLLVILTGTRLEHIDRALASTIRGPWKRRLFISTNRGSELWGYDASAEPVLLHRRVATPEEDTRLDTIADAVVARLHAATGLELAVVRDRLNRRKIDLFPTWSDPPKARIAELIDAVDARLGAAGWRGGVGAVVRLARAAAQEHRMGDARITSDGKHVEVGLTDKADAVDMVVDRIAGGHPEHMLVLGDELGAIGGIEGSDARMRTPRTQGAVFATVGPEPGGVPPGVIGLGGGPERFREVLLAQAELGKAARRAGDTRTDTSGDTRDDTCVDTSSDSAPDPTGPAAERSFPGGAAAPECGAVVPSRDPTWLLVEAGFPLLREHEIESCFTVGNGAAGVRGSLSEGSLLSSPGTRLAGAWVCATPRSVPALAAAPEWTGLNLGIVQPQPGVGVADPSHCRALDLAQGVLWRTWRYTDSHGRMTHLRFVRFASLADRRLLAERFELETENWSGPVELVARVAPSSEWRPVAPGAWVGPRAVGYAAVLREADGKVVPGTPSDPAAPTNEMAPPPRGGMDGATALGGPEAAPPPGEPAGTVRTEWPLDASPGARWRLDRVVMVTRDDPAPQEEAGAVLGDGFEPALAAHVEAWRARVSACEVELDGDPDLQRAIRFACHHLVAAANPEDEHVSVGARALTGPAYMGHVFWDTELWLLPVYTLTWPRAARALVMYRAHTLPAARRRAQGMGYRGALYAWESAATGDDVTPPVAWFPDGRVLPVLSGELEHHVSAAVAWAAWAYWEATADDLYLRSAGAEVLLETARFWASRGEQEADGRFHIRGVIGPDEYHEDVDDNAYTNGMAAWNLERGAEVARLVARRWPSSWEALHAATGVTLDEAAHWESVAAAMYVGIDAKRGVIEQFAGYFDLEDIDLAALEPRTAPVDVVLGPERVRGSQLIKQADVVMLLALLGDRFTPEVRAASFRYYEPRTGHGSSLSPPIYALVAARLGDLALAERYVRRTAAIDLDDRVGNAATGVHIGALGGLWQSLVMGFAGLRVGARGPELAPALPGFLRRISVPFEWRQERLRAEVTAAGARIVSRVDR